MGLLVIGDDLFEIYARGAYIRMLGGNFALTFYHTMTAGVKRIVIRDEKSLVNKKKDGLFLYDKHGQLEKDLGYKEHKLLDFTRDSKIAILNGNELLIKGNANRTSLKVLDISTNKEILETTKYWAFRGITDTTSGRLLLEHDQGLTCISLHSGEVLFEKKTVEVYINHSDIDERTNTVYMPSSKRTLRTFHFALLQLDEVKVKTKGKTENVKILQGDNKIIISDSENVMYCFALDNFDKSIWTIDFKEFEKPFDRVWCYNIYRPDKHLACVQSFYPAPDQHIYEAGRLWIFDPLSGQTLDSYDYANFGQEIASDFRRTSILLDDLREFDLRTKTIKMSEFA